MSSNAGSLTPSSTPPADTTSSQGTTSLSLSSSQSSSSSSSSSSSTFSTSTDSSSTSSSATSTTPTPVSSTTTTTPTTPPTTPTPTPSESPTSTSPVGQTTTTTPADTTRPSSTTSTSSSTPVPFSTSSTTSQVATTYSTTNSVGSIVFVTTTIPTVVTTTLSPSSTSNSNSRTGIIVGAVVGGVGGIAIIILLLLCIRRRARKDEFDGNFDPDRVVGHSGRGGTLPHVDLADDVTPFPHPYTADGDSSTMRQFGGSSYLAVPSSLATSGQNSTDFYTSSKAAAGGVVDPQSQAYGPPRVGSPPSGVYPSPADMYGAGSVSWSDHRGSPPPSTTSHNTSSARGAKEREAMGRDGQGTGLGLATQQEVAEGSDDVVVHQDAGRAPAEDHPPPREIPPAYESIQHD